MRLATWRPALRIAHREARRARGRSVLILLMIALPVLALTAADVLARSAQLDPDEKVARRLGSAQALLVGGWGSGSVRQAPDPSDGSIFDGGMADEVGGQVDPLEHVPAGWRTLTSRSSGVVVDTAAGVAFAEWSETPVADPALRDRYEVRAGSVPRRHGDVAVSVDLFERLGVEIGGQISLSEPAGTYRLAGVLHQLGVHDADTVWALPGELIDPAGPETATEVYLAGDRPVTWADVQALNEHNVLVTSRQVLLHPPADSEVPFYAEGGLGGGSEDLVFLVLALTVVVVLAGLEVGLLAGAAFAVGARRQARSLGLLAATGGRPSDVRRVVLAGGLVLGAAGAVVGVVAGLVLALVARPVLTEIAGADFGRFDLRPLELAAIALLGVVTGLLSAVLPARTAARADPVLALRGRRGQVRTPKKVPAIGLALTVLGIALAALGSTLAVALTRGTADGSLRTTVVAGLIAGGAALAQIGLIVTSPAIIGLAGRWSGRLPLVGRLALRDAARHRGRSAPAMAAVLTAVTGSMGLLLFITALDDHDRRNYTASWPQDTGGVSLASFTFDPASGEESVELVDAEPVVAALRSELPRFEAQVLTTTYPDMYFPSIAPGKECFLWSIVGEPTQEQFDRADQDPRCTLDETSSYSGGSLRGTPVGGADAVAMVAGAPAPAAVTQVLREGGVVVFDPDVIDSEGRVRIEFPSADGSTGPEPDLVTLPGVYLEAHEPLAQLVLSEGAVDALGARTEPTAVITRFAAGLPTEAQEEAAVAALREVDSSLWLDVERGYDGGFGLGLLALVLAAGVITLGAAGISTGLAQADARADHATLAAVGAAPRVRRMLAAAQALSIAGLGTGLGVAAGFVPAVALIAAIDSLRLVIPWWHLLTVLVGIPLLAAACAWVFTRSRVPLERRVA